MFNYEGLYRTLFGEYGLGLPSPRTPFPCKRGLCHQARFCKGGTLKPQTLHPETLPQNLSHETGPRMDTCRFRVLGFKVIKPSYLKNVMVMII